MGDKPLKKLKMKIDLNTLVAYVLNLLIGIIGFFLVISYNRTNQTLSNINRDILTINKDIVSLKLEITEMNGKMMTEDRVREIIRLQTAPGK